MPFPRGRKPSASIPKHHVNVPGMENQEDAFHVKRSPSSPQGAPKKRSAFVDITNANKIQASNHTKKEKSTKKIQKSSTVAVKNEANLKKSNSLSSEGQPELVNSPKLVKSPVQEPKASPSEEPAKDQPWQVPEEFDIDKEHRGDCCMTSEYAKEVFDYLKCREEKFVLQDYMHTQPDLNKDMRGILVDWMVEVQENFELNHETLYLAVKLTDHYLSSIVALRESLQLIGSTSMLIASKFEERSPPCIDDFLYICDDAYKREEMIAMEVNILQTLKFDISIPVPYLFLRRYAKCVRANMETLTLARYACELSLLEVELVPERASCLASACLLLALTMKSLGGWTPILEFHTGYTLSELGPLVRKLHSIVACPSDDKLKAVRSKYSHNVFFEVAKIPVVDIQKLEEALK
ncbi:G2/mitotic-specific cyclin-B3 [Conger conger]|uniref:G2/mitotic-specific cyclin-B3 n=1 Tax=Conger conger TaxID=82655 RepID=UPI002A5AB992|nr:G2/mitotic-specific cyclin-B3 [Conger conger]